MSPREMLIELRSLNLSEREIAARLGINQSTVNRTTRGETAPSWELGQRIAELHRSEINGGEK